MYPLIVISGPSGAGKSTIVTLVRDRYGALLFAVSATTRPPRPGEKDGVHYYFVSEERFSQMIREGALVEHVQREHRYGTPWSELEKAKGGPLVLDVDVAGAKAIRKQYPDAHLIFITPPGMEELERRLRDRRDGMEEAEIRSRLKRAEEELSESSLAVYDYIVVNDDREICASEVLALLRKILEPGC